MENKHTTATKEPIVFKRYTERNMGGATITFDKSANRHRHIRFNAMACRLMELGWNDSVEFVKIEDEWFVCKTNLNRGYILRSSGTGYGLRVHASLFIDKFMEELRYSADSMTFKLQKTNQELAAQLLFKIYHHKSLK
jgi:hypothetical protein